MCNAPKPCHCWLMMVFLYGFIPNFLVKGGTSSLRKHLLTNQLGKTQHFGHYLIRPFVSGFQLLIVFWWHVPGCVPDLARGRQDMNGGTQCSVFWIVRPTPLIPICFVLMYPTCIGWLLVYTCIHIWSFNVKQSLGSTNYLTLKLSCPPLPTSELERKIEAGTCHWIPS